MHAHEPRDGGGQNLESMTVDKPVVGKGDARPEIGR